mmetsp:Transcript_22258/g.50839  ORF Transcript_22258/g.50839 Transcript_22258/m.50839 type:complete len:278 (+) Transcript_22258:1070-1903(+)
MCWNKRNPAAAAPALHTAIDTARIEFAPSLALDQPHSFLDPSRVSTMSLSIVDCWVASKPINFGAMRSLMLATALSTPFPIALPLSPSRSSNASYTPVEAPDGTEARNCPKGVHTSTSTVGLPRESKISRAVMCMILPPSMDGPACGFSPFTLRKLIGGCLVLATNRWNHLPSTLTRSRGRETTSRIGIRTSWLSILPTAKSVKPAIVVCTTWYANVEQCTMSRGAGLEARMRKDGFTNLAWKGRFSLAKCDSTSLMNHSPGAERSKSLSRIWSPVC